MKNIFQTAPILVFATLFSVSVLAQNDVSLKIGGSFFINCKKTIVFSGQPVMTVSGDDQVGRKVNFDLFSPDGSLDASLMDGNFSGPNADYYFIKTIPNGFTITDQRSKRIVLKIVSFENKAEKRRDMHVWADFFLPNGGRFQCTPDESNVPILQMMSGATFKNNDTAIDLN